MLLTEQRVAFTKRFSLSLCALLVASCSLKTLYNHLDIFIAEYISDMVTLDDMLSMRVESESTAFLDWHRSTQLSEYADWFDKLQNDTRKDITQAEILAHFATLEEFWNSVLNRAFHDAAPLMALLNAKQQQQLFENIEINNTAFYTRYVDITDAERVNQFLERIEGSLEPWLDDLSDAQQAMIREVASKLKSIAADRFRERQRWQRELLPILKAGYTAEVKTEHLRAYFKQFAQNTNPRIDHKKAYNRQLLAQFMAKLVKSLDMAQTQHLKTELAEYAQTFRELALDKD